MPGSELVSLCPGPSGEGMTVPLRALQLLWHLEEHGYRLSRSGDGLLIVEPGSRLTTEDRAASRLWRNHLLSLIAYVPPVVA